VATDNGAEAIELFSQEDFDLVITDLLMPAMTGLDIARRLKLVNEKIPIILLAGWGRFLNSELLKAEGIDHLLAKPCNSEQLLGLIREILGAANYHREYQAKMAA
jgi:two-component system response regulator YesN